MQLEFLHAGQAVTGNYYAGLFARLHNSQRQNKRGKLQKPTRLLQDNAPAHRAEDVVDVGTQERCLI